MEQDILQGRIPLNTMLGACGDPPPVPDDVVQGALETGSFNSKALAGTKVSWTIAYPPGLVDEINIPVCLALHGRGASNSWPFDALSLQFFLADAVLNHGVTHFAIASIDGGDAINWHPSANGDNPQAMVTDEFVPLLNRRGYAPTAWVFGVGRSGVTAPCSWPPNWGQVRWPQSLPRVRRCGVRQVRQRLTPSMAQKTSTPTMSSLVKRS